ncbi:hypothetical protein BDU57DRAFT_444161 [Ampelomyces quisqualis]|uniref:Uncharacterized protein n=1 Tax=Ampelomyces quisqualis TaxID=50730 RepID=A0A6A5QUM3_AMPQU|nr:hypothetical protein BDU57DRAFT_444161 [Ampelomyces quisqualis]
MAPSSLFFSAPILPSQAHIALAIAIVRSKPINVTIREYVLRLREHCKPGQPASNAVDYDHYLDLVGYWQHQCQRAQEECNRLRSINIRLERSNQALSQQTNSTQDERLGTLTTVAKRRAAASPTRPTKRPKAAVSQTVSQTQEGIDSDYEFLEALGADGTALTEALYSTHKLCRATDRDGEALCHHLVRTSSALGKVVRVVAHNYEHLSRQGRRTPGAQSLSEDRSDFSQALTIVARAFMSVLVGMTKMTEASGDERLSSLVVCELAEAFKATLLAIELSACATANTASKEPPSTKKGKAKASDKVVRESVPARSLAHFLIGLMGLLDKTNVIHQRIFDGFAFLLLERVGRRLYYCTFGCHRSAAMDDELTPVPEPIESADIARQDADALGIRLELRALVLILERAMGLAPHHMNPPSNRTVRNPTSNRLGRTLSMKTLPAAPKGRLSSLAKDRLQRTLINCMYGRDDDDEFLDVLIKPVPAIRIASLQNVAKIDDGDVEQWYKEEVWRLVGWDIMAREGGW